MPLLKRLWTTIEPSYYARRGAHLAALATVIWAALVLALNLHLGLGLFIDFLFVALVLGAGMPLIAVFVVTTLGLLRRLPLALSGFFVASTAFVSLLWFGAPGFIFAVLLLFIECCLGATLATILRGGLQNASRAKRVATWSILMLSVAGNLGLYGLLHNDGVSHDLPEAKDAILPMPLTVDDPSRPGPYPVKTLYYGSGDSLRRMEYGPSVAIKTRTVDASAFFEDSDSWKARLRKQFWGFGMEKLPLNGQVFYPGAAGPFPLFMIVHGNHQMSVPSDTGYAYLCELLASRGFVAVSIDENFLNRWLPDEPPGEQPVRAWLLLEHLRLWHEWAKDPKNPMYGKADLNKIALAGHSRGGEAAATAALFNGLSYLPEDANVQFHYGYAIKSVIAIAPADGQYKPADQWRILKDVNYLTLQGSNDADISSFVGSRQYEHVRFSGSAPVFKSELYVYNANHGQFNTVWGRTDSLDTKSLYPSDAASWLLNLKPLLSGDAQRQIAKVFISAFLETTLHDRREYRDLFRDYRKGRHWLPKTLYLDRFQDQTYEPVCSFDEDADLTSTTMPGGHISGSGLSVWREGKIPFRNGSRDYNGVFLGWNLERGKPAPDYSVDLPPVPAFLTLDLSVAAVEDDTKDIDFTIEVTSGNGQAARAKASDFARLGPLPPVHLTKLGWLDRHLNENPTEPVFQSIHVPFAGLGNENPAFNPYDIKRIRLIFDQANAGELVISGIGLSK